MCGHEWRRCVQLEHIGCYKSSAGYVSYLQQRFPAHTGRLRSGSGSHDIDKHLGPVLRRSSESCGKRPGQRHRLQWVHQMEFSNAFKRATENVFWHLGAVKGFSVTYRTNGDETTVTADATGGNIGFCLDYQQRTAWIWSQINRSAFLYFINIPYFLFIYQSLHVYG